MVCVSLFFKYSFLLLPFRNPCDRRYGRQAQALLLPRQGQDGVDPLAAGGGWSGGGFWPGERKEGHLGEAEVEVPFLLQSSRQCIQAVRSFSFHCLSLQEVKEGPQTSL